MSFSVRRNAARIRASVGRASCLPGARITENALVNPLPNLTRPASIFNLIVAGESRILARDVWGRHRVRGAPPARFRRPARIFHAALCRMLPIPGRLCVGHCLAGSRTANFLAGHQPYGVRRRAEARTTNSRTTSPLGGHQPYGFRRRAKARTTYFFGGAGNSRLTSCHPTSCRPPRRPGRGLGGRRRRHVE